MKIDRLISIIMILLEKKRVGAKELANTFEVSLRTIYRDIETINISGIPVRSTPGVNGGFEIMEKYKINNYVFSNADLSTLLIGLSNMPTAMNGQEVVNVLAKIKNLVPASSSKEIELNANQIHIDLEPWTYNRNTQMNLTIIKEALTDKKILLFDYYDHHRNETKRSIEPYQLILKNSYWYLYGYCLTRKDYRLFKISRISKLQIQEQIFLPRDYPTPQLNFGDILETLQTEIKICIHKSIMDRVLDFCDYKHFSFYDDTHYIVKFPFIENDYYYNILFSFGDKCECLGPLSIREEIKRRLQAMVNVYEK